MGGVIFPSSRLIPERKGNDAGIHSAMLNLNNSSDMYLAKLPLSHQNFFQFQSPKIVLGAPNHSFQRHCGEQF